jgi:hypothetical protein
MSIKFNIHDLCDRVCSNSQLLRGVRNLTIGERRQINRILKNIAKAGSDPNIDDLSVSPLSQRQIMMILSSGCIELIDFLGIYLAYEGRGFSLNEEDQYSIILYLLSTSPEYFQVALQEFGLTRQADLSNTLETLRVRHHYRRRPKKTQRHRGYTDQGHLPSQQQSFSRLLTADEAAEEARLLVEHNKRLQDTIELIKGMIQ